MARAKLDLQAYQQDILSRLQRLTEQGGAALTSRLGISINGYHWLVALEEISEVIPLPEILPVPQTRPWFMGVANVRGNLYALSDLAGFMGYPPTVVTADSRVLLLHQQFEINAGLLVERLLGLHVVTDMERQDDVGEAAGWCVNRYRDAEQTLWHELDISRLLAQPEFLQVAA